MSKTNITILAVIVSLVTFSKAKAQGNHKEFKEWPALNTFHEAISQTFHPAEEGNFEPIRQRSAELRDKAVKLEASTIPADLNRPEVVSAVKELVNGTAQLHKIIQDKGSDDVVKKELIAVHESFHKIVGLCSKGEEGHEHEHSPSKK